MPTVSVILQDSEKTIEISGTDTIFNELDDKDLKLPAGCLSGSCGTCKIEVLEGAENLKEPSAVEKNTIESIQETYPNLKEKTIRLSCRAKATGDVKIKPVDRNS